MFKEIFLFETRYQLKQPLFFIAAFLFFLLSFGAVTTDSVQIGGAIGNVHRNAPYVITQLLLVMTALGVFLTTAFVSGSVHRDFENGTDSIFFSMPIRKLDFLLGRFGGALLVSLLVFAGVVLGVVLGSLMPWLEPERVGAFRIAPYLVAIGVFVLPNLLLTGSLFFSLASLTRSLFYTYAGVILFFVGWGVAGSFLADLENQAMVSLADPFGFASFELATKYWTVAERNSALLVPTGPLLYNRLIWTAVALAVLAFTCARFRFTTGVSRKAGRKRIAPAEGVAPNSSATGVPATGMRSPAAVPVFSQALSWRQYVHRSRLEISDVLKSLPFVIILFLGAFNVVGSSFGVDEIFGTPVYPVTHLMLQVIQGSFLLFVVILVTFYAGELVWRERALKMDGMVDALPVPTWVLWASKLTALVAMLLVLLACATVTAIGVQVARGYFNLEPRLYAEGLFLNTGINFIQIAVLALFFQALVNHKHLGFLMMVLYFISFPVLQSLHFEHNLYRYAAGPSAPYSDMNGYGHFVQPLLWFHLYWTFGAVLLAGLVHLFWVRGTEPGVRFRLKTARRRLTPRVRAVLATAGGAFLLTGGFIFYNTNILNRYLPGYARLDRQAEFEKKYKKYEGLLQPRIQAVQADVDIYPDARRVGIRGRYTMTNKTGKGIDTLHVTLNPDVTINEIRIPGARLDMEDARLGYRIYRMETPLAPSATMDVGFDLSILNRGFVNNDSNTKVVRNGTFIDSEEFFPHLGYTRVLELLDPNERRKRGLPPVQRMPKVDDQKARLDTYVSREADWVRYETTVSTSPDQIAIAPGYLQREWRENGRRYFHYAMDSPILNFYSYLSADYAVKRDRWKDVAIEIDYDRAHPYNIDRMIDAVKKSLDYFTANFGPYQHRQVRIIEFPRYARFASALPNTIPFSESIGFIARLKDEETIDYVFYVTAHEVAHQWWAHQVIGGNVQGATVMSETMAQYSALMVMEKEYGREKMRKFLKYELDSYLRGRGGERIEELPLILVENQPYIHYRKGSLVMYALRDYVGEEALNAALKKYVKAVAFQGPPYTYSPEFLSYVEQAVPDRLKPLVSDLFRKITLYDNRATRATWVRRDDGKYIVRLDVDAAKFHADGSGVETPVPISDPMDVGVFGAKGPGDPPEGKILALEKRTIDQARMEIEIVVDQEPRKAGIDPFNKLIDRNPENNITSVTAAARPAGAQPAAARPSPHPPPGPPSS